MVINGYPNYSCNFVAHKIRSNLEANKVKELKLFLDTPRSIVIVTHWSPDGDAMGSSLGLYNYLIQKKHKVTVITPNDYPEFLFWLPGNDKVLNFSKNERIAKNKIEKAEFFFCLDFNSLKRIDSVGDEIGKSDALKCIIDHHPQPDTFADFLLHSVKSSSTCELIYDFMVLMGDKQLLNKDVADCLYTGIMTDTGSFRFNSTSPKTHRVVAELIEAGTINSEVHGHVYDGRTEDQLKLLGYSLNEKLNVFKEHGTAFISLSEAELKRFNYKKGDTEGLVNYALSIEGVYFAAFIVERDEIVKLSFRSKGNFDVNEFARKHFNGGGHKNAAGGMSDLSLDETIIKFVSLLPK